MLSSKKVDLRQRIRCRLCAFPFGLTLVVELDGLPIHYLHEVQHLASWQQK